MKTSIVLSLALIAGLAGLIAFPTSAVSQEPEISLFEGELVGVDAENESLTVENPDGIQMTFHYNEETLVQGVQTTVQGLSRMTGTRIRVIYTGEDNPLARRIVIFGEE
ncbi:MAG: hypothetical protein R3284_07000 [Rubricoccaceae bacterium]|nr:hypothetical protein [Rubricoccaceae bacterium]